MNTKKTFPIASSIILAVVTLLLLLSSLDSIPLQAQEPVHPAAVERLPDQVLSPPENPVPPDGAFNVTITSTFHWGQFNDDGVVGYEIAMGVSDPPPVVGTTPAGVKSYTPSTPLNGDTVYHWHVTAVYTDFTIPAQTTWTFTTTSGPPPVPVPITPTMPMPADAAVDIPTTQELVWQGNDSEEEAISYAVSFGTVNPPPTVGTMTQTVFVPPTDLISNTTYFWRVTSTNSTISSTGELWEFSTILPTGPISVTTGSGGYVTSGDGAVQAEFPSNAVTSTTTITAVTAITTPNSTDGYEFINRVYDIAATGTNGEPVTHFSRPFTMTLFYNDSDWQQAGIANESGLNVYWWDGNEWAEMLPCAGCIHDSASNTFNLQLDHLSEFTIMERRYSTYLPLILNN